jgi:hypothetical protein
MQKQIIYWPNKKTRARQYLKNENYMTMTAIKHCAQWQKNGSVNPMGRELQQRQFWLSSATLRKTRATQQTQPEKYTFANLTDLFFCEVIFLLS